jgi:tripeptide aminopeptidase
MKAYERLLKYVGFDTQSKEGALSYPSTEKQLILAHCLCDELLAMGIPTTLDNHGYVIGNISGNTTKKTPKIAFIAHMDTSPDASGKDIKPRIVRSYDGKTILLNKDRGITLDPSVFPTLKTQLGNDLIVTDGTTLLGADDKAGIAEIMTVIEYVRTHPEFIHGPFVVVFTPDEEVGSGTKYLDIAQVSADFAYTLDGSRVGEIAYENFNAAGVDVTINGKTVHPGSAKGVMVNSIRIASEFDGLLPAFARPESTEKYEGFNHLHGIEGACEKTVMKYLIRNHDKTLFERQKQDFRNATAFLNTKYGPGTCVATITDSYFNMRDIIEKSMFIVEIAKKAIRKCGLEPVIEPIRGGTDGARLTYLGLSCPNLGTGGYNYHGPFEYVSIQEMDLSVEII